MMHCMNVVSNVQVRQPIQGMQGVGIMGAIGSSSAIRAAGVPQHPLRSITSSLRAQGVTQSPGSQVSIFCCYLPLKSIALMIWFKYNCLA